MVSRVPEATIASGQVLAFRIPTDQPESDGTAAWDSTSVVVVELSAGGATGLGFTYTAAPAAQVAQELIQKVVIGRDAFNVSSLHVALDREVRNWGRPGLVSTAISAIDICLWDLKARLFDQPLLRILGSARDEVAAYGSGGFTSYTEKQVVDQLSNWASSGLHCVKMKSAGNQTRTSSAYLRYKRL